MSAGTSTRVRVLAAVALTLALASAASFLLVWRLHLRVAEDAAFSSARKAAQMYDEFERSDTDKLTTGLQGLLSNDDLQRAFVARDRAALLALAAPIMERLKLSGVTHWYFITPDRRVFLRVHEPEKLGDLVERVTVQRAATTGVPSAGKELGRTAFALRVVSPWRDEHGRVLGFMELGEEIDHFLGRMKQATGDEFGLLVKKEFLDEKSWSEVLGRARNTWNDRPDAVLVDTTSFAQGIADFRGSVDDVPLDGLMLEKREDRARAWIRAAFPIRDISGRRVGALFILHDFTDEHLAFDAGRTRGLFIVLGVAALGFALIALLLEAFVFRRATTARSAARHEVDAPPDGVRRAQRDDLPGGGAGVA
ncbi:MAG TPA: cache domain-containing protein [Anaeromyxobacteraceae bacterium]|nr:cache domain-containing protein [Anaeromyxobacteraceae bacterium]